MKRLTLVLIPLSTLRSEDILWGQNDCPNSIKIPLLDVWLITTLPHLWGELRDDVVDVRPFESDVPRDRMRETSQYFLDAADDVNKSRQDEGNGHYTGRRRRKS